MYFKYKFKNELLNRFVKNSDKKVVFIKVSVPKNIKFNSVNFNSLIISNKGSMKYTFNARMD